MVDLVTGEDGLTRCAWGSSRDYLSYHDHEWGKLVSDDDGLYERLTLEAFQSGLSWLTILRKRDAFVAAFDGFDPARVAAYGPSDVARLMAHAGIVRNRAKIEAAIANAAAFVATSQAHGSFAAYLADAVRGPPQRLPQNATAADVPATTPASDRLSRDLRARGFRFLGSTVVYAFMQSVGLVDDHLPSCFRYGAAD